MQALRPLVPVLGLLGACQALLPARACSSAVYCVGDLLSHVQLARIFPDCKTFVDMMLVNSENDTLADFARLLDDTRQSPSREQLAEFVGTHFADGDELEPWAPPDLCRAPPALAHLTDPRLRAFAADVVGVWARLGRRARAAVRRHPDRYSFLYVPHGFIAPGGRFKELYYWDSYWIVRGLLISNMTATARGVIENLLHLVQTEGYVPNGSRVYYRGRSQPPLLAAMMADYVAATGDLAWLAAHAATLERELQYWLDEKQAVVEVDGRRHVLLRYRAAAGGPRPEAYAEDHAAAARLPAAARAAFYRETRSAAESGWDFSSRWLGAGAGPAGGRASRVLPVDLNAIFANALQLAGDFRSRLKDRRAALKWWSLAKYWRGAIQRVLWHEADGTWYDYDLQAGAARRQFYPSCAAPLWARAVEPGDAARLGARLAGYLAASGALAYPGGVPASLVHSGEQWDFPNAWPPSQSVLVGALEASGHAGARALARRLARAWVRANMLGWARWGKLFEKYSALVPGRHGGGGEYEVQDGFGWTCGVLLELLQRYGDDLAPDVLADS